MWVTDSDIDSIHLYLQHQTDGLAKSNYGERTLDSAYYLTVHLLKGHNVSHTVNFPS